MATNPKLYVVEHLDPELEDWSSLEYKCIAEESVDSGARFLLSSVPRELQLPDMLSKCNGLEVEHRGIEEIFAGKKESICLLDPAASQELETEDGNRFDIFLFGGILGDDPPRDRTAELRKKGYEGRRLGPIQMTTDTAVRVTRMVVQDKVSLKTVSYIDYPKIKVDEHESHEMPFRYVRGQDGLPVMPKGMAELIKQDSDKGISDLL